jgi:hypothetical protein
MPSTSAKQHRFMEAVAHNPKFAKKAGVSQSVGKDFAAADKGKKFGRGGRAGINIQNTQHGSMDMPFKSLKKYAGMRSGGKVRRFQEGGVSDAKDEKLRRLEEKAPTPYLHPSTYMDPRVAIGLKGMKWLQELNILPDPHPNLTATRNRIEEINRAAKRDSGMKSGGSIRGGGIEQRGKTKGRMC